MALAWPGSTAVIESSKWRVDFDRINSWLELLIFSEVVTVVPCLIHALVARYWIRRGWRQPVQSLFAVWGGTIGMIIPLGVYWLAATIIAISIVLKSSSGYDIGILLMSLYFVALVASLISTAVGYLLGYLLGRVWVKRRHRPERAPL